MSNLTFEQPAFDWEATDLYCEFKRFKQHVEFVFKGPLATTEAKARAGWLGMWIGKQGREVFKTFHWVNDEEKDNPDMILNKLEDYVKPRKNKRTARFRLAQRKQGVSESFDNFVKDVKLLVMDCEYADPDDIITDMIIAGVKSRKVQERLLEQGQTLSLEKAISIGRQYELTQLELKEIRGEDSCTTAMASLSTKPKTKQNRRQRTTEMKTCNSCGYEYPKRDKHKCPAIGSTCHYCKGKDHWKRACLKLKDQKNRVNELSSEDSDSERNDSFVLNTVDDRPLDQINSVHETDKWYETLSVNGEPVEFLLDSGAKRSALRKTSYDQLLNKGETLETNTTLYSFSNHAVKPLFRARMTVQHGGKTVTETFEIVDGARQNLLRGNTAETLGLIARLYVVQEPLIESEFPELSSVSGTLPGKYEIKIDPSVEPVVHPARKQPFSLKPLIVDKLREMERDGFITKVDIPTEWVSSMVASVKKEKVRICIDPRDLNRAIRREHHPMRTIEEVVSSIPNAKVFSVLDAKSGFLQIELEEKSSYLTTFNTPLGRYRWNRLPFGLKCSPEIFQRIMDQMLEGIDGTCAIMDDILIAGSTVEHHDEILGKVVERAKAYNLKLNFEKCRLRQSSVPYIGHVITSDGLKPDPEKVRAIAEMPSPSDKEGVRRFLGLIQYLSKFIPNLSELDSPLRGLLKSKSDFVWTTLHEASFSRLKHVCSAAPVLALYDVSKPVEIQCDASKSGLGAVLLQNNRPVAYSSRAMTATEQRYAQIEKEMLSIVHAATKFHCYIFGKSVTVYNDHKPLEQIFKKPLPTNYMRLQRMLMRLQAYDITVKHMPGRDMLIADTLSRAYLPDAQSELQVDDINMLDQVPVTKERYEEIIQCTKHELQDLVDLVTHGWPENRDSVPPLARAYWNSKHELSVADGVVFKGMRIVIPPTMRSYVLKLVHESHLGIVKCKQRAREVVFWPGMNAEIEQVVRNCAKCAEYQNRQAAEPLKPLPVPDLPYGRVGCDLFEFEQRSYVLLVDYYSRYIDVIHLQSITARSTIEAIKSVFATHGIPKVLHSDCGSQFKSQEFKEFCKDYGVEHVTSSPHFQSANGEAERAIQTVKRMWRKSPDKHLALLNYRTTPLDGVNLSPAQLLMSRRPRNKLPASKTVLQPRCADPSVVKSSFEHAKERQKACFDKRAGARKLSKLEPSDPVRMAPLPGSKVWKPATVIGDAEQPRSYYVQSGNRVYRRNRKHLRTATHEANRNVDYDNEETPAPLDSDNFRDSLDSSAIGIVPDGDSSVKNLISCDSPGKPAVSRYGRQIKKPVKLDL